MLPRNTDLRDDPLPAPGEQHWVSRRKARVVTAVLNGEITLAEASLRYRLSEGEFQSWLTAYENYGAPGLRATRFQIYRDIKKTRNGVTASVPIVVTAGAEPATD